MKEQRINVTDDVVLRIHTDGHYTLTQGEDMILILGDELETFINILNLL